MGSPQALVVLGGWAVYKIYSNLGPPLKLEGVVWLLLFLAGLGWLTYYVIAGWLNRTYVAVSHGRVAVRHGPIPWVGNKEVEVSNLIEFYTTEREIRGRHGFVLRVTYQVHARTRDDGSIKLVDGLQSFEQAFFIAKQVYEYSGMGDVPAAG